MKYLCIHLFLGFALLCTASSAMAQSSQSSSIPREISVSGHAERMLSPQQLRITLEFQADAQEAKKAIQNVEIAQHSFKSELEKAGLSFSLRQRTRKLEGPNGEAVRRGSIIRVRDIFALETSAMEALPQFIDRALNANCTVHSIEYQLGDVAKIRNELIQAATADARQKAELVASQLGVSLGPLLSVAISEEPQGAMLLEARQLGASSLKYDEKPMRVHSSLRYEIAQQ